MRTSPRLVHCIDDLVELIRQRRDEVGITNETLDSVSGLQSGYSGKLLAPVPIKGIGEMSLGALLGALALKVAHIEFVEDPEQALRVKDRWVPRKRPKFVNTRGSKTRARLRCVAGDDADQQCIRDEMEDRDEAAAGRADCPEG